MFSLKLKHLAHPVGIICLIALVVCYGEYRRYTLENQLVTMQRQFETQQSSTTLALETQIRQLDNGLSSTVSQNAELSTMVQSQQNSNGAVAQQVSQINDTVGTLNKLQNTDPELLQKYSKVYFLNENYVPKSLTTIPSSYTYEKGRTYQFLTDAWPFLQKMMDAGTAAGVNLEVISAYRSFGTQAALKSSYTVTYGAGSANSFSADQGYSEHQLGTALDFTTPTVAATFDNFDKTPEYAWLEANAYKYGFILSYPQGNAYYEYEPWHWRFVGVDLADGKNFYDLDQRTIDDYLPVIFD